MNIITDYLKKRKAKKNLKQVHEKLLTNPTLLKSALEKHAKAFGKDKDHRSPKQWQNLIRVYGMNTVCEKEQMTIQQVEYFANETANQKYYRLNDFNNSDYKNIK